MTRSVFLGLVRRCWCRAQEVQEVVNACRLPRGVDDQRTDQKHMIERQKKEQAKNPLHEVSNQPI